MNPCAKFAKFHANRFTGASRQMGEIQQIFIYIPSVPGTILHESILHDNETYCIYTVSQKKLCQLIFCSLSVKYEPISIKIGRIVPEYALNKADPKMPTSPKICACTTLGNLTCQIEPLTQ